MSWPMDDVLQDDLFIFTAISRCYYWARCQCTGRHGRNTVHGANIDAPDSGIWFYLRRPKRAWARITRLAGERVCK